MTSEGIERRLAAILSADAVGHSRLMGADEQATIRTITAYRTQIGELVAEHRGRVVDSPGDNLLAEFPTALDAVQCAIEIQKVIGARNAGLPEDRRMEFRERGADPTRLRQPLQPGCDVHSIAVQPPVLHRHVA